MFELSRVWIKMIWCVALIAFRLSEHGRVVPDLHSFDGRGADQRPLHLSARILLRCSFSTATGQQFTFFFLNPFHAKKNVETSKNIRFFFFFFLQKEVEKAKLLFVQIMNPESKLCQNLKVKALHFSLQSCVFALFLVWLIVFFCFSLPGSNTSCVWRNCRGCCLIISSPVAQKSVFY